MKIEAIVWLLVLVVVPGGWSEAGQHETAKTGIEAAIDGRELPNLSEIRRVAENPGARNIGAMAWGGLCYSGHEPWERFADFLRAPSEEQNSPFYASWTLGALLLGVGQHQRIDDLLMAELAWAALTVRPWQTIRTITPRSDQTRPRDQGLKFRGQAVASCGNRYLWGAADPLRPERGMAAVVLHYIRGHSVSSDFDRHPDSGFVMAAARKRLWAALPASFLENLYPGSRASRSILLAALDAVPQLARWEVIRYAGGSQVTVMSASTMHTRGPVSATVYDAEQKALTLLSASTEVGAGNWTRIEGQIGTTEVHSKTASGAAVSLAIPQAPVGYHVIWDAAGAREVGFESP